MKNAEMMRDIARQKATTERPDNKAFWADPKVGQAEWAVNKLLTELATGEHKVGDNFLPIAG